MNLMKILRLGLLITICLESYMAAASKDEDGDDIVTISRPMAVLNFCGAIKAKLPDCDMFLIDSKNLLTLRLADAVNFFEGCYISPLYKVFTAAYLCEVPEDHMHPLAELLAKMLKMSKETDQDKNTFLCKWQCKTAPLNGGTYIKKRRVKVHHCFLSINR